VENEEVINNKKIRVDNISITKITVKIVLEKNKKMIHKNKFIFTIK
jgi:hypothetical protein